VDTGRLAQHREDPRLIVATRADLLKLRRAAVFKTLRYYRVSLRWARASEWLAVMLTGYGAWLTLVGCQQQGAAGVMIGTLAGIASRRLERRIRRAQREAYLLLEGHGV
jgi:hypothetical protein